MQRAVVDERYTLIELLGSGGVAEVYLAHDDSLDRDVALKILKDRYAEDEEFVERFRSEAKSASRFSHPNIVSIYDQGRSEDGAYYVAMEYVPWGTLKDRIRRDGALQPRAAAGVALQISDALSAAHKQGVIHGDVKSQNVLITRRGDIRGMNDVKVTDFGIARAATSSPVTATGAVLSATGYVSPEQAKDEPAGPASDLYSLGVVLYEMLTGNLPYVAEDSDALKTMHVSDPLRSPREANPDVPKSLDAITRKLLAKSPENRYVSAEDLSEALERAYSGLSPVAFEGRRRGVILLVAGASLLSLALLVLLAVLLTWALIPGNLGGQPRAFVQQEQKSKADYNKRKQEVEAELKEKQPVSGVNRAGGESNDTIQGTDYRDVLGGWKGDDEISGYGDVDKIHGNIGNDTLFGGSGSDVLLGGWDNDTLWGGPGADELYGYDDDDTIDDGDDGEADTIRCGGGFDTVTADAEDNIMGCEDVTIR